MLRADASPQGVNCICLQRRGYTALRGWRPISAALPRPVPSFYVPGHERLPFHHQAQRPQDNRVSIGKTTIRVNLKPCGKVA